MPCEPWNGPLPNIENNFLGQIKIPGRRFLFYRRTCNVKSRIELGRVWENPSQRIYIDTNIFRHECFAVVRGPLGVLPKFPIPLEHRKYGQPRSAFVRGHLGYCIVGDYRLHHAQKTHLHHALIFCLLACNKVHTFVKHSAKNDLHLFFYHWPYPYLI